MGGPGQLAELVEDGDDAFGRLLDRSVALLDRPQVLNRVIPLQLADGRIVGHACVQTAAVFVLLMLFLGSHATRRAVAARIRLARR